MKNLTAIITDGMHNTDEVEVKSISVWINRNVNHTVNDSSGNYLIGGEDVARFIRDAIKLLTEQ